MATPDEVLGGVIGCAAVLANLPETTNIIRNRVITTIAGMLTTANLPPVVQQKAEAMANDIMNLAGLRRLSQASLILTFSNFNGKF